MDQVNEATQVDSVELAFRRTPFLGGEPIVLADGNEWLFPKPVLEFGPKFGKRQVSAALATSLGPDFDEAVAYYDECCRLVQEGEEVPADKPSSMDGAMNLAVIMLRLNYDLADEHLTKLLRWRLDDPASDERWGAIFDVARGNAPKQKAGGSV